MSVEEKEETGGGGLGGQQPPVSVEEDRDWLRFRIPVTIKRMLWDLTRIRVGDEIVGASTLSDVCREALYRGLDEMLKERKKNGESPRQEVLA